MGRQDFLDDPHAPVANSLVPAASAIVVDPDGRILLQRRRDNDQWALPGGAMEIGETIGDCARREVEEETGLQVRIETIVGLYSNPRHVMAYDNGEVRQEFSICFSATVTGGTIAVSEESHDVQFFPVDDIEALPMVSSIRERIKDYLSRSEPAIR